MNKFIFLFFAIFSFFSNLNAQFEWEELEPHNAITFHLHTITLSGKIIVYDEISGRILLSENRGLTWEKVISCTNVTNCGFRYDYKFKEDNEGRLHVGIRNKIYRVDTTSNAELQQLIQIIQSNTNVVDFIFLKNNEIIVLTEKNSDHSLWKFSSDGSTIIKVNDVVAKREVKIFEGEDDAIYLKYEDMLENNYGDFESLVLHKYDIDLNRVFKKTLFTNSAHFSYSLGFNSFTYLNGRFYSKEGYSDDEGRSWNNYNVQNFDKPDVRVVDSIVVLRESNKVAFSENNGETFTEYLISTPIHEYDERLFIDNRTLYFADPFVNVRNLFYSDFDFDKAERINTNLGRPSSTTIAVGNDENVILQGFFLTGESGFLIKSNSSAGWDPFQISPIQYSDLISMNNGDFFHGFGYLIEDNGATWTRINHERYRNMAYKNGIAYLIDYNDYLLSYDNGKNWNIGNILYPQAKGIRAVNGIGTLVFASEDGEKYIFVNSDKEEVEHEAMSSRIEGSYQYNNFYMLEKSGTKAFKFYKSVDGGASFSEKIINVESNEDKVYNFGIMQVDHNDNIFIKTSDLLLISSDFGETWTDITPEHPDLYAMMDVTTGYDNHIYIATIGTGVLKSKEPVALVSATNEIEQLHSTFEVYPNPAKNNIFINSDEKIKEITIYSILGDQVVQTSSDYNKVDVSNLIPGIYNLCLNAEDGSTDCKMICINR